MDMGNQLRRSFRPADRFASGARQFEYRVGAGGVVQLHRAELAWSAAIFIGFSRVVFVRLVNRPVGRHCFIADLLQRAGVRLAVRLAQKDKIGHRQPIIAGVVADVFFWVEQHGAGELFAVGAIKRDGAVHQPADKGRLLGVHQVFIFLNAVLIDGVAKDEAVRQERIALEAGTG